MGGKEDVSPQLLSQSVLEVLADARDLLAQHVEFLFDKVDIVVADEPGRIIWQWSITLAVFALDVSKSAEILIRSNNLRAAEILQRCIFEYWVRLEFYHLKPSEAAKDHAAMDDQARYFASLLGKERVAAAMDEEKRQQFERFMKDYSKPTPRSFANMLRAVIKQRITADDLYARHYVLGSSYVHGNEVATQDVFTLVGGKLAMNWQTSRLNGNQILRGVAAHVIHILARLELAWDLIPEFEALELRLRDSAQSAQQKP